MSRKNSVWTDVPCYHLDPSRPIYILRYQPRWHERWVTLWQPGREGQAVRIDPQKCVTWMTGLDFGRAYCVLSLLMGLQDGGFEVVVRESAHHELQPFNQPISITLVYWLYGYLKARHEENFYRLWLGRFRIDQRPDICDAVARHFMRHPGLGINNLNEVAVPVGVLLR